MKYYRIVDWERHYENNRTRDLVHMSWVPMPNRWDGDGYTELMDHPNAAAHFGAWCSLVQVASRCEPRGSLLRSSRTKVRGGSEESILPHDVISLSRMTRIPELVFDEAIPRLINIGWIEELEIIPHEGAATPQEGAAIPHPTAYGTEGNGKEGKRKDIQDTIPGIKIPDHLNEVWPHFVAMRKTIKKPLTPRAIQNLLGTLSKYDHATQVAMIEQSITNSWAGVFPLHQQRLEQRPRPVINAPYHQPYRPEKPASKLEPIGDIVHRLLPDRPPTPPTEKT